MATLLRVLRDERGLTQAAMLDRLERRARELDERDFALSIRQLARLEAGEIKTVPRQANRRTIEAEYGKPFADLVSCAPTNGQTRPPPVSLPLAEANPEEHFSAIVAHLARVDHQQGPSAVLPPALAVYRSLIGMAKTLSNPSRDRFLRVAARCAELVGWFYQDSGRPADARSWTAEALDLAEGVQASELVPYILMRRSSIEVDLAHPDAARLLAERALRGARTATDRALALREVAAAHALDGSTSEFRQATDAALVHADGAESCAAIAPYCSVPYLQSEAGWSALRLGDAELAVGYLTEAAGHWPNGQERDRALCLARLALAHSRHGDLERSVAVALEAARDGPVASSPRVAAALEEVVAAISRARVGRSAPGLDEQLASLR